ncbi:MAG: hypothetical protein ABH863_05825 [Candidatus Micrarchaeota archaeon]
MPLEWDLTELKQGSLLHWKKLNPKELMSAISKRPIRTTGQPLVSVYDFGPHQLAVRRFEPDGLKVGQPRFRFTSLIQMVKKRTAVLEMPVALYTSKIGEHYIVTLWKKGTRSLEQFLEDPAIFNSLKEHACITAIRSLVACSRFPSWAYPCGQFRCEQARLELACRSHKDEKQGRIRGGGLEKWGSERSNI